MTASFRYDALGRRIEKTVNSITTRYLYDGMDIIQEQDASGTVTANYLRALTIDEPLMRVTGTEIRHYKQDALGSVIALAEDTGTIKTVYAYDPFGSVTVSGTEPSSDNPLQYTGRESDATGFIYYRARYYSPMLQRFISEDPIGFSGGDVNLYGYVGNDPVNYVDPLGLTWESNWNFFWDWVFERGSGTRFYGPNTTETQEMMDSPGADKMRSEFKAGGCKSGKGHFDTIPAYLLTMGKPWKTGFQVGGFVYTATANANGTVTYRIKNTASIYSFFLHIPGLPHKPRGGAFPYMGNVDQTFEWTEANPCGCP